MFLKLNCVAARGLECLPVEVEIDINKGQTAFNIVGLPDTSIQEAKERIHSALKNSDFKYPFNFRITINLAPADVRKNGPIYDLPMSVGLIILSQKIEVELNSSILVGELTLDGRVRHVDGILPIALYAKEKNIKNLYVPESDAKEASLIDGINIYPVQNLSQIIRHLKKEEYIKPYTRIKDENEKLIDYELDMALIKGQEFAKRALEIAAAGNHNVLMSGPPGSGKTLLAKTFSSILPPLTEKESLEITKIFSVAGLLNNPIIKQRPFRSPHHTISNVALVGGGRIPRPGEISLSHRGVLFLDELPEFPRQVLEVLRQPLEDGVVTISRAEGTLTFPARFTLIASQNPCPCGYLGDESKECICTQSQILNYQKKISGPLLDRIDLHVEVPRISFEKLTEENKSESSQTIRKRVSNARAIQNKRFKDLKIFTNAEMGNAEIKNFCPLNEGCLNLLKNALTKLNLSARSYNRIIKLSRTIADLAQEEKISPKHIAEALQFRPKK